MKCNGAEILINCLKEQGVDTIFGYPGGTVLDIYDALYRDGTIRHVITSHEQGAAHAADGYARVTGRVGVCLATSGPGATNLVTGIATAFMDSIPVVAITGNVGLNMLGRDSFQEIDITGITMPITKHNFIIKDVKDLAPAIRQAFKIANSGRKGPVLIDILKNVQIAETDYEPYTPEKLTKKPVQKSAVEDAVKAINAAKKPLIMLGGGCIASEAEEEIASLAEKLDAPVACTLMGLGAYPAGDARFMGMHARHRDERPPRPRERLHHRPRHPLFRPRRPQPRQVRPAEDGRAGGDRQRGDRQERQRHLFRPRRRQRSPEDHAPPHRDGQRAPLHAGSGGTQKGGKGKAPQLRARA